MTIGNRFSTCSLGFSLIEIMVANLLGLVLIAGMAGLYLASKRQYVYDEQLARLQENGRYAISLLRRELLMAGFYGGLLSTEGLVAAPVAGDCSAQPWALDPSSPVGFADDHPAAANIRLGLGAELVCIDGSDVAPASDVLAIRRTAAEASVRDGLLTPELRSYSAWRWYLQRSVDRAPQWRKLALEDLGRIATDDTRVSLWEAVAKIFYIRNYSDPGNRNDGVPALCMEELVKETMQTRCMVEGVENLQLEVGVDTDGNRVANLYLSPGQVTAPEDAVSARVHLLVRSVDPVFGLRDAKTYRLGQQQVSMPGDRYLRRVFSTTVQLRNLVPRSILVAPGDGDGSI